MERDYENHQRPDSRIVLNDYPSSHLPPTKRPKFWGDPTDLPVSRPLRTLSYVERPCIPRHTNVEPPLKQHQQSEQSTQFHQPWSGDNWKCRQETDNSGVSAHQCSPCYVSSALTAGDRHQLHSSASAQATDAATAAEVTQLSNWLSQHMERAALSGCASHAQPIATSAKPASERPTSAKLQGRGSRSVADTSVDHTRSRQRCLPQPSLQFMPVTQPPSPTSTSTTIAPFNDKPVPFEAWTDDGDVRPLRGFERPQSDADRYSSRPTGGAWTESEDYSEPVECELARTGRRHMAARERHVGHCRTADGHHHHDHHAADPSDVHVDWNWDESLQDVTQDDEQPPHCVSYDEQMRRHGWKMEVHGDPFNLKKPCMAARPAYSQSTQPSTRRSTHKRPDSGRPVFQSTATHFHNVRPTPRLQRQFMIHPDLMSENVCSAEDTLHSLPIRQCDIAAAVIQRASQRRYVSNPFVY